MFYIVKEREVTDGITTRVSVDLFTDEEVARDHIAECVTRKMRSGRMTAFTIGNRVRLVNPAYPRDAIIYTIIASRTGLETF